MSFIYQYIKRYFEDLKKSALFISVVLFTVLSYQLFFTPISIELEIYSSKNTPLQIFYAGKQRVYNEKQSREVQIKPDSAKYDLAIPTFLFIKTSRYDSNSFQPIKTLKFIRHIRIDPLEEPGEILIKKILIRQNGYKPLLFETQEQLRNLRPANDIESIDYRQNGAAIVSSGKDPQLEITLTPQMDFGFIFLIFIAVILVGHIVKSLTGNAKREQELAYAPYLLTFAFALILISASTCKKMHADEGAHIRAGGYYLEHWLPPEVCEVSTENTYSTYGISRLNSFEIVYFIAGKFVKSISPIPLSDKLKFRFFNISLFFILLLLAIKRIEYRILFLPFLISPQIWYIFSYFNSDAFAIFVISIISYQAVSKNSITHYYLTACKSGKETVLYTALTGVLFSFLLLIKINYLVFVIFLFGVFILKLGYRQYRNLSQVSLRVLAIILVVSSVWGIRYGLDIAINGFDKKEKLLACREKLAKPLRNPTTPLEHRHPYLQLKERGVSIGELFEERDWGWLSFWGAFGSYSRIPPAPDWYLRSVLFISIIFSIFLISSIIIQRQAEQIVFLIIVTLCSILLIALSVWNSWTASFQPQGRYLMPIFTMTGALIFNSWAYISKKSLRFFTLLMFLLSSYSFLFVGLRHFPKF